MITIIQKHDTGFILIFSSLILFYLGKINYLLFHSIIELFCVSIAFTIFQLTWNSRKIVTNSYIQILGIAYLFIGGFDLFHMLAYKGMNIFINQNSDLPTQLWIIGRYFEAGTLILAVFSIGNKIKPKIIFSSYFILTAICVLTIFFKVFPVCYIEGEGLSNFKIISEYIIILMFLISLFFLFKKREYFDGSIFSTIFISIIIKILSEISFTLYIDVYGLSNLIGHFLKFYSFYLLYIVIIKTSLEKPYTSIFKDINEIKENFQKLFSFAPVGIIIFKIIRNINGEAEDFIKKEINPLAEKILLYRDETVLKEMMTDFTVKSDLGRSTFFEKHFKEKDEYWEITLFQLDENNIAFCFTDITKYKKSEFLLKNKMEELSIFHDISVDRELTINEYRKEINELLKKAGGKDRFEIV